MKMYILIPSVLIFCLLIAAWCWTQDSENVYQYSLMNPNHTIIIIVGDDVTFDEAIEIYRNNLMLNEMIINLQHEKKVLSETIADLHSRMNQSADDLKIVEDFLRVTDPE